MYMIKQVRFDNGEALEYSAGANYITTRWDQEATRQDWVGGRGPE
jgi:hypothetical protein